MRFTIQNKVFQEALAHSEKFTSIKIASVQALQGAQIITGNNYIEIVTTNLNDFYHTKIPADIKKTGEAVFDVKKATEFLCLIQPGNIDIYIEDTKLIIKQGKTQGGFNLYNKDEFPELPKLSGKEYKLNKTLINKIPNVLFSASKDETRPVLTGVYFTTREKKGYIISTDGFRLSLLKQNTTQDYPEIIIPATIINEVIKLAENEKNPTMVVSTEEKLTQFIIGKNTLYSRVIEGEFPPFEKVIPKTQTTRVVINRQSFIKNTRTIAIFAREQSDVVILDIRKIGIYIKPKGDQEKGARVFQEINNHTGNDIKIAFNFKYILEFLNRVKSDNIIIELTQETAPGVFKEENNNDFIHIIMPLRTEETSS